VGPGWARRVAVTCAVVASATAALAAPVALAERSDRAVAGGNGVRHFYALDGYADSNDGCGDFGENPNVKPGRGHTSTIVGYMWLDEGGLLHADGEGRGDLQRDGSFHLDFPRVGPAPLRRIEGRIGPPNPDGLDAPVTGGWTVPYPNGTSKCLVHFVIIDGYVNLEGGFGVPLTSEKPAGDSLPVVPIGVGVVALLGLGGLLVWRKPWKPRCRCACRAKIVGERVLYMGDDVTWALEQGPGGTAQDGIQLVGTDNGKPPKQLRQWYACDIAEKCSGGGTISNWRQHWELGESARTHVALGVKITGQAACADGTTTEISCYDARIIQLLPHCGPEITDQFIHGLNLTLRRLRVRAEKARRMGEDIREQAIDFLFINGGWIAFRPFAQRYEKGEPPYWQPGACPSCPRCGATVTFLGTCIDNYIIDAYLYGVVCGFLGLSVGTMTNAGLVTKWLDGGLMKAIFGGHHLNPETWNGALPAWQLGHPVGARAWSTPGFTFNRNDTSLKQLAAASPHRDDCMPCSESVPTIEGPDWPSMDWDRSTTKLDPF